MDSSEARQRALVLVDKPSIVMMLGTVDAQGAPEIKAMVKMRNDGLRRYWFCSNTSTRRAEVLKHNGRSCLYAYEYAPDAEPLVCRGVMLAGTAELSWDDDLRRSLWQDFMTLYYPQGPLDPDFVVVQFTAERGNYYEGLENADFTV
ncbi:pyridoxamine 5'-phosphate oxidase family protein [Chitiniphilus eburneus]|nr:pyridoxamine 5'-phosphate oxidase family protein [Chitiniphilus eburneus]